SPSPSPGLGSPGSSFPGSQPSTGGFSRSPFWQGLAGGVAGGFLGNMLFGGRSSAYGGGVGGGGGGIGLMDLLIIGGLIYFFFRYMKKKREQQAYEAEGFGGQPRSHGGGGSLANDLKGSYSYSGTPASAQTAGQADLSRGMSQIRQYDASFNEAELREKLQDMFFRIQAGWMNRSLEGIRTMMTPEMTSFFEGEFDTMKKKGRINRLENIAVRKVELAEAWQEAGKDYVTVLFTANLLDYTVDDRTGEVVGGDKLNPVKFEEFWTFARDIGTGEWRLSAINQVDEPVARVH
ncbi:MAG: Tim44 domain-containing protein, partial [Acidobacteriota bacterium]